MPLTAETIFSRKDILVQCPQAIGNIGGGDCDEQAVRSIDSLFHFAVQSPVAVYRNNGREILWIVVRIAGAG